MSGPRGGFWLESTLVVPGQPNDVFEFLADTRNFKALDDALIEVEPKGPLTEGMTGRFVHRRGPMAVRTTWRVTQLDAPRHLQVEVQGMGYAMTEDVHLEPAPDGTRARLAERVWPTSLAGRFLVALSGGVMRRDLRARAKRLEAVR